MDYKVYCIIVTYNAMKWIDKCLTSLRQSSIKAYPVIVDNCSKDDTVDFVAKNFPEVHLIINKVNRGFGQANNQGIEYSYKNNATHFFLLNQDTWIYANTIRNLVDIQDKFDLAIVSPLHLNGKGDLLDYNYFKYSVINDFNIEFVSDLILKDLKQYYLVSNLNAAAWMLSRKTIKNIGGFDPIFFHYGEDGNYCQRVKFNNCKIAFVPNSHIHHDRERYGDKKAYSKYSLNASLLILYADINRRFWNINKVRIKTHLLHLIIMSHLLLKFDFKSIKNILRGYYTFITLIPKIFTSRSTNKKIGPNWLDLN